MRLDRKPTLGADVVALIAMALAMLLIVWARIELYGTGDLEDALSGETSSHSVPWASHSEALVRNRWVAGFNQ